METSSDESSHAAWRENFSALIEEIRAANDETRRLMRKFHEEIVWRLGLLQAAIDRWNRRDAVARRRQGIRRGKQ